MNILVVDHWFNHGGVFTLKTADGNIIKLDDPSIKNIRGLTNGKVNKIFFIAPEKSGVYKGSDQSSDEPFQFRTVEDLKSSLDGEKINYVLIGYGSANLYTVMRNEGESTDPVVLFSSILADNRQIKMYVNSNRMIDLTSLTGGYKRRTYKSSKSKKRRNNTRRYKKKSSKRRSGKRV